MAIVGGQGATNGKKLEVFAKKVEKVFAKKVRKVRKWQLCVREVLACEVAGCLGSFSGWTDFPLLYFTFSKLYISLAVGQVWVYST